MGLVPASESPPIRPAVRCGLATIPFLDNFRIADHPEADRFLRRYSVQAGVIQLLAT